MLYVQIVVTLILLLLIVFLGVLGAIAVKAARFVKPAPKLAMPSPMAGDILARMQETSKQNP